jgi:hypothetical protein
VAIKTGLIGTAGEYSVAAELSPRRWLATVTIKNAPGVDVLAMRTKSRRSVAIQTKTASPSKGSHSPPVLRSLSPTQEAGPA